MTSVQLSSPDCWLDCLATLPDCDLSDLCSEVVLVGREGDTTVIPTVVMLATSQLFRQLKLHEPGELLIFPEVSTVHLEQVVHLLTSGTSERPGELREVGRDLQQVQHVMNLLVTGIDVSLANTTSDRARSVEEINNNASVDPVTPKSHTKNNKYSRRELKRLISTPHKAGRPGVYCKVCMKSVSNSNTLRTHIKLKHPEATFACKICNQKFIYEVNLKKHVESKHSEGSRDVVSQTKGKSTCPQCYKLIGNKYMKMHIESVHKGLRYECGECKFLSTTRAKVKKHCSDSRHQSDSIKEVHVSPSKLNEHWTLKKGK